jgi:crotonobetainyl-CoA:carnitine CoA-transferase CaiB-like acyl-CoA transferase/energy-converting hydrogenase Eha subunit C
MMKLHWSPKSPYVRKVMITAHELGIAERFELIRSVAAMLKPNAALMVDNPLSKIPALVLDDGRVLVDSVVICEYLDTLAGGTLFPRQGESRWQALVWHALGDGLLDSLILWRNERERAAPLAMLIDAFELKTKAGTDQAGCRGGSAVRGALRHRASDHRLRSGLPGLSLRRLGMARTCAGPGPMVRHRVRAAILRGHRTRRRLTWRESTMRESQADPAPTAKVQSGVDADAPADAALPAALAGVRILDLSRVFAGPFATQMLADLGAEVIKVERPGGGDEVRGHGQLVRDAAGRSRGFSAPFAAMNRGKHSVAVDIATAAGQELVRALACEADVLVENFKVGDLARYRLDHASLAPLCPDLIYCSITGFGQDGPRSRQPGYDLVFQAMSGLMSITGHPDGEPGAGPQRVGYSVSDITAAYHAVIAILAALHARERGHCRGQHIDIALLDSQIAAASHIAIGYLTSGQPPGRIGARSSFMSPYEPFDCSDGPLVILCGNDGQFARLMQVLGLPDLASDARFASNGDRLRERTALVAAMAPILARRTRADWIAQLDAVGVPCAPILDMAEALVDPQVVHRGLVIEQAASDGQPLRQIGNPIRLSGTPIAYGRPAPALGADTEAILKARLGLTAAQIDGLRDLGVIGP